MRVLDYTAPAGKPLMKRWETVLLLALSLATAGLVAFMVFPRHSGYTCELCSFSVLLSVTGAPSDVESVSYSHYDASLTAFTPAEVTEMISTDARLEPAEAVGPQSFQLTVPYSANTDSYGRRKLNFPWRYVALVIRLSDGTTRTRVITLPTAPSPHAPIGVDLASPTTQSTVVPTG